MARNGAVTLDDNTFTSAACATTTTTTTVTAGPTTATGTTVTATVPGATTGTVTFTVNGVAQAPVAVDSLGHATLTLAAGATASTPAVTARFNGTPTLLGSTSASVGVSVAALPPVAAVPAGRDTHSRQHDDDGAGQHR